MMMMTMLCVGFTSCGDDDEEDGTAGMSDTEIVSMLQGTWNFNSGTESVNGYTIQMSKSDLDEIKSMMSQAMGARVYFWDETLEFSGMKVNGVSYAIKNKQLIMEGMELFDGFSISIKSISSSKLVLHEVFSMDGIEMVADMEYLKEGSNDIIDDPVDPGNGGNITDCTATTSVKRLTLENEKSLTNWNYIQKKFIFYEDYNNSYLIVNYDGRIAIAHFVRSGTGWGWPYDESTWGIKDLGKVSGLSAITSKAVTGENDYYVQFQPKHGYAVMFTTEDGVKKYMRIYAESYTLDSNHNLATATIQYQLY